MTNETLAADWSSRWGYIQGFAAETLVMEGENLPPIFVLSHARLDVPVFKTIPALITLATLVVPQERYVDYVLAWPDTTIVAIPEGLYGVERGVAQARQFCLDSTPTINGEGRCVILDDDITGIAMMYQGEDGKASSAYVKKVGSSANRAFYSFGVFCVAVMTAIEMMDDHPDVVIAGPQNRNDQRTLDAALTKYDLNYGRMPIGFVVWDVGRFKNHAGQLDMRYNPHGEDLWATMTVLWTGGSYGRVPSVLVSYYDEHTQSTLKTPENEHLVRQGEWERIQTEAWADHVRVKWDFLDRFAGAAPNLKKFRDTAPFHRVLWDGSVQDKPKSLGEPATRNKENTVKVAVYHPFEVTEEQRLQLGAVLTGKTKPKYAASRDQIKEYFLQNGEGWPEVLAAAYAEAFPNGAEDDEDEAGEDVDDEDLV
jgi:hypothetical protein